MGFLKRHKKLFIFSIVAICLGSIIYTAGFRYNPSFMERSLGYVITPVQGFFTGVFGWFDKKITFVVQLNNLQSENERLKQEISVLTEENSRLRLQDQENQKLSELLNIDRKYADYNKIGAAIIAKDPGNWYFTFTIDKGTKDGLKKNMVVLAAGGLAGRITEVGYNYATVVTIIDETFSVSAKGARTGNSGIVKGDIHLMTQGECRMEYIDADADLVEGDEIVTSHLSSIYPPGISIGHITKIGINANSTKYAIIKPVVDFRQLETVLVINQLFEHEKIEDPA